MIEYRKETVDMPGATDADGAIALLPDALDA